MKSPLEAILTVKEQTPTQWHSQRGAKLFFFVAPDCIFIALIGSRSEGEGLLMIQSGAIKNATVLHASSYATEYTTTSFHHSWNTR